MLCRAADTAAVRFAMISGGPGCRARLSARDAGGHGEAVVALSEDVTAEVVVNGEVSAHGRHTVLRLTWSRTDPLAVGMRLCAFPDHPALPRGHWSLLRDFLRYGLEEPTGDGDVRLAPDAARRTVRLELTYDGRCTTVEVPCATVSDFLDHTERICPSGEEATDATLDALIARLLEDC